MAVRWYVVRVDDHELKIERAMKKPEFISHNPNNWPQSCFVDGTDGENAVYAGGFMSGRMNLNVGFEDI